MSIKIVGTPEDYVPQRGMVWGVKATRSAPASMTRQQRKNWRGARKHGGARQNVYTGPIARLNPTVEPFMASVMKAAHPMSRIAGIERDQYGRHVRYHREKPC